MKLGLCTISNKELPVGDVLGVAADAGYEGVEIWGKEQHVGDGSPSTCASIVERAADLNLEIAVYGSYLAPGTDGFEPDHERELGIAERLGADVIRVWPGEVEYGDHDRADWDETVEDLTLLADRAADSGLAVTVEKHAGRLSNATEGARRLIEAVNRPNCGLNWQPLFDMSEDEILAEAAELAPLSNNVHIQAPGERGTKDRVPLEDAFFDVAAALERFASAGFSGYVEVEFVHQGVDYATAVKRDADYLRSVFDRVGASA